MGDEDSPPKLQETPLMDGEMKNKVVDLSPFFLFEAVGDSEGDHFDHQSMMMKMMMVGRLGDVHNHDDEGYDDDDAESCSHDVWDHDTSHANGIGSHDSTYTHVVVSHDNQHHHFDDDIDGHDKVMRRKSSWACHDGDDGNAWNGSHRKMVQSSRYDHDHHNNKSTSEVMSTANSHASRNSSCVDSCEGKKMSEKERSRLFWETCLAS